MNRINYGTPGGFPLDQDVLNLHQENIFMLQQMAALCGPRAILTGCEVVGLNANAGYVVINGEVLPFMAGAIQTKVRIKEILTDMNFEDGGIWPAQVERYAEFGDDGVTNILWADFRRNKDGGILARLDAVWMTGDIKEIDCTPEYMAANFDGTGLGKNERLGWAISNGSNGTKDRRGRVSLQLDATKAYANTLGAIGGEEKHTLTIAEMPAHSHAMGADVYQNEDAGTTPPAGADGPGERGRTKDTGGGQAHNILQPYIVTLVIQKL